jgi:hypothetical protein
MKVANGIGIEALSHIGTSGATGDGWCVTSTGVSQ